MSDPNLWGSDEWGDFYNEHTDLSPEQAGEAANCIQDIINAAHVGNVEETCDGIAQSSSGPLPSA